MEGTYYLGKALVYKSNKTVSSPELAFFFYVACPRLYHLHDQGSLVSPGDLLKNEMYISWDILYVHNF